MPDVRLVRLHAMDTNRLQSLAARVIHNMPASRDSTPSSRRTVGKGRRTNGSSKKATSIRASSRKNMESQSRRQSLRKPKKDSSTQAGRIVSSPEPSVLGVYASLQPYAPPQALIIGIDFGTTFSAYSYLKYPIDETHPSPASGEVKSISNWPDDTAGSGAKKQVPSELWYPANPHVGHRIYVNGGDSTIVPRRSDSIGMEDSDSENGLMLRSYSETPSGGDEDDMEELLYGYQVQKERYTGGHQRYENLRFERMKTFLFEDSNTALEDKDPLRRHLEYCINHDIISKVENTVTVGPRDILPVVVDFLTQNLKHVKQQLVEHEGLTNRWRVSFVMAIPISCWPESSSWILKDALEIAVQRANFTALEHGAIGDLSFVLEPEAAGYFCMSLCPRMRFGETFIVIDGGGGTVDLMTFTVEKGYPLRLKENFWKPSGSNCGASYLNSNFFAHLKDRLKDETYLESNGESLDTIINELVLRFENDEKRSVDVTKWEKPSRFRIHGLKRDDRKRFRQNHILFEQDDWMAIFSPLLKRTGQLLKKQFKTAIDTRIDGKYAEVTKVFLVGGFGASPSLQSYLKHILLEFEDEFGLESRPEFITTTNTLESVTAVASGAVLQSLEQKRTLRRAISSIGVFQLEHYEPREIQGHFGAVPILDKVDGQEYVETINYFLIKGTQIPAKFHFKPILMRHTIPIGNALRCKELVYVCGSVTKSHYPLDHQNNEGAIERGHIITDFEPFRDQLPQVEAADGIEAHWVVEYSLVPVIENMTLRYESRYPADETGATVQAGQICIAAVFKPGE